MKGLFFQKPLEFHIQVEGESWSQGQTIKGKLTIKNHAPESQIAGPLGVHLAVGDLKKVKNKTPGGLKISKSFDVHPTQSEVSWEFPTDLNCQVTDSRFSYFLVYGVGADPDQMGALELKFKPIPLVLEFVESFKTHQRFVQKSIKFSKGQVDIKLIPPDSKAFSKLESVTISFSSTSEELQVEYDFALKKVEATAMNLEVTKVSKTLEQTLAIRDCYTAAGRLAHETLEGAIAEALASIV